MKKILASFILLLSMSALAQSQQLKLGQSLQLQCPASSEIMMNQINTRTATVYCGSVCRLEVMTKCDYDLATDPTVRGCGGTNTYLIVLKAPGQKLRALTNNHYDYELVRSNLEDQASRVSEEGICDKVVY